MPASFISPQVNDTVPPPQQDFPEAQEMAPAINGDTSVGYFTPHPGQIIRTENKAVIFTPKQAEVPVTVPAAKKVIQPPVWNFNGNFLRENELNDLITSQKSLKEGEAYLARSAERPGKIVPQPRNSITDDWFFGIFLMITLLFIWIRIFYGKFYSLLGNAIISFQISAKLFQEKNTLLRRVSIVLDFIYMIVLSIFIYELARKYGLIEIQSNRFNQYIIIFNVIMLYGAFRLIVMQLTGHLFLNRHLLAEYAHNNFVMNKGVGLVLFPVVITAHYFPPLLSSIILISGLIVLVIAFVLKSIRAYQIIKRKDVLLFYLILYLCTLEILPLLLGYKVIISLI